MSLPVILFDDIELEICTNLRAALAARDEDYCSDVYVSHDLPKNADTGKPERRDRMVIVRRDGGPRLDVARDLARVGVNVWAESPQVLNDLARMTSALMWSLPDGNPICKVTPVLGPSPIADPSGQPRLFMTFEVIHRGTDA
jgi:hypothetical protein